MHNTCVDCGLELELDADGLCASCEQARRYDEASSFTVGDTVRHKSRPAVVIARPALGASGHLVYGIRYSDGTHEARLAAEPELELMGRPPLGARVRLVHDVDRYPHFIAPADAKGLVVDTGGESGVYSVRLDEHLAGAEEWSNEVCWSLDDGDDPTGSLEVIR